jgi:hypothetical protein
MMSRNSNDPNVKSCYKTYCKSLAQDIIIAKRLYYNNQITNSNNTIKSSWNIVKTLTRRKSQYDTLPTQINLNSLPSNSNNIPDSFNKYFLSVADSITSNILNNYNPSGKTKTFEEHLSNVFNVNFSKIKYSPVSTNEL